MQFIVTHSLGEAMVSPYPDISVLMARNSYDLAVERPFIDARLYLRRIDVYLGSNDTKPTPRMLEQLAMCQAVTNVSLWPEYRNNRMTIMVDINKSQTLLTSFRWHCVWAQISPTVDYAAIRATEICLYYEHRMTLPDQQCDLTASGAQTILVECNRIHVMAKDCDVTLYGDSRVSGPNRIIIDWCHGDFPANDTYHYVDMLAYPGAISVALRPCTCGKNYSIDNTGVGVAPIIPYDGEISDED